ncbi:MAG: cobalt transport protein, partial [Oscillospiraceae bacterium]|nr:cobalt transport protein [Oscillospiraceae bacterium]
DNCIDSLKEKGRVLNIVITWALENGIITANSMTARGFGSNRRTSFSIHHIRKEDRILILITLLLSAVTILSVSRNALEISFYPEIHTAEHRGLYFAGLSAYTGLAILPSVLQAEAALRWKYLQSKI